ncbi:hypothetical protein BU17DRAFT_67844 [Hysterangium stoloniferum]|nr:hypothetical protein BU17DRAFT_67844 [Hysterangium stoloniferum]
MDPPRTPERHRQQERDEERRQRLQMTSPTVRRERSNVQNQLHAIPPPSQPFRQPPVGAGPSQPPVRAGLSQPPVRQAHLNLSEQAHLMMIHFWFLDILRSCLTMVEILLYPSMYLLPPLQPPQNPHRPGPANHGLKLYKQLCNLLGVHV